MPGDLHVFARHDLVEERQERRLRLGGSHFYRHMVIVMTSSTAGPKGCGHVVVEFIGRRLLWQHRREPTMRKET